MTSDSRARLAIREVSSSAKLEYCMASIQHECLALGLYLDCNLRNAREIDRRC